MLSKFANLVPRAFSSFKMAVGETPGQGCWNTPRIVEYFVTWHMIKWLFRTLFPVSGGPVCFLQSETVVQTKRRHFIVFAWRNSNELLEPLRQPWPGVSPTAILNEEKALGTRLQICIVDSCNFSLRNVTQHLKHLDRNSTERLTTTDMWQSILIETCWIYWKASWIWTFSYCSKAKQTKFIRL